MLITGAGGEIGHGLIERLAGQSQPRASSRSTSPGSIRRSPRKVDREITGSILDRGAARAGARRVSRSSWSSTSRRCSRRAPSSRRVTAHQVNVEGTLNLLEFAQHEAESHGRPVVFMYPSSIAAYGLPSLDDEEARRPGQGRRLDASDDDVRVQQAVLRAARPLLRAALQAARGRAGERAGGLPLRAVPGLISAVTVPSGGTSDYAPEMIHAAAKGEPYALLRPAGHAHPVHGDAGRRRRAAAARRRAAREP